ncbi:hypothetical protein Egran_02305 [Elaphomyces granulatus]|uniref:HNH nuclease domain-containing protein n=1 Tax=Elaphomyces granulatus TaxID=519963 RepID=A0A232M0P4_9EURO|nr:hypothetical protein Egran_02305 [Elaphomyces granulatus]
MSLYSRELCPSRAQEHGHLETELGQGIQNATFPDSPSRQPDSFDGGAINSVQNGILLRTDIHQLFDSFAIAINPDDDYKVISFVPHYSFVSGIHIGPELLRHPERPVEQLFRWHFRQAVLANMKGAGEPVLEHDFPPGSDMIGEVLSGPRAAEVMEFHLFSRLATEIDV